MGDMMKQAQQLQAKMAGIQEQLASKKVEATVGGGMVTVTADGQQNVLQIKIKPEVVKPEDTEMLEDLILSGVNEALRRSRELAAQEMGKLTGALGLPGLF